MKPLLATTTLIAGCICTATAAPFVFNNGDVILGFQATSGAGATKNVFFRIGSGTGLRDETVTGTLGNIGATLAATYGANWYSRTDLYCGAFGNLDFTSSGSPNFTAPVDGDPSRTLYLTKGAVVPRTGEVFPASTFTGSALGSAGNKFSGMEAVITTLTAEADSSAILDQTTNPVEWNNGWTAWNPVPGAAFDTITGGIQQNFGKLTPAVYLDLQRVVATNTGASPEGVVGGGQYVATIEIAKDGTVRAAKAPLTFYYNDGDVLLGFQATSGVGATKNVFFRLGPGTAISDGLLTGTLGNIGATLSATYGSDWYSRTDLYCGAFGNLNASSSGSPTFTAPVDGDPSRTLYLTKAAGFPKEGEIIAAGTYTGSSLGSVGTKFSGMETMAKTLGPAETDTSVVLDQAAKPVEWNNGWSVWNPVPGAAFDAITGGIQQNFGKPVPSTYLDLQRVLATNTGASPAGVVGGGSYVTTIEVDSSGNVKLAASNNYQNWIDGFPALTLNADKLTSADPDGDSLSNLEEFAFGSDPSNPADTGIRQVRTVDADGDASPDLTLTIEVRSGAQFSNSGGALVATIDNVSYRIEGSTDLSAWNSPVSEVTALGGGSPSPGYVLKTFRLDAGEGLAGKGFLRAGMVR